MCEDHRDKPWDGASDSKDACHCGGAGLPCLTCNPCDDVTPPRLPDGYISFLDQDGWKN